MNESITLSLPHEIFVKAQAWAKQSGRPLAEFLAESIERSLASFSDSSPAMHDWSEKQVIDALENELEASQDLRLGELLRRQQNAQLTVVETLELQKLMAIYQQGLLLKSVALREAVRRGLRTKPAS